MPLSPTAAAAATRLQSFYNDGAYDAGSNAGGFGQGGHRVNWVPALDDVGVVGEAAADAADDAATAQTAAEAAQTAAEEAALYYLGASATNPTTMRDSSPLVAGAFYYNSGSAKLRVYSGGVWNQVEVYSPPQVARKTADYTVTASGERIHVDSSSAVAITAKATPSSGDEFEVARYGAGAVTVSRNGSTIAGISEDFTISTVGEVVKFVYLNGTWRVYKIGLVA